MAKPVWISAAGMSMAALIETASGVVETFPVIGWEPDISITNPVVVDKKGGIVQADTLGTVKRVTRYGSDVAHSR